MSAARHSEVVVIGAGPAGIAAAVRAAQSGARVLLVDDNAAPGGQIWRGIGDSRADNAATKWRAELARSGAHVLLNARVISACRQSQSVLVEDGVSSYEVRWSKLILATGARELFLPFPGWTLPGITGLGGLQAFAKSGMPVAGKRIVLGGSGPLLLAVAAYLRAHGAKIILIAEQASWQCVRQFAMKLWRHPGKAAQAVQLRASLRGVPYHFGCWISAAHGTGRVEGVTVRQRAKQWTEPCDFAGVAYGLVPNVELPVTIGCAFTCRRVETDHLQRTSVESVFCAGEGTGIGGVDLAMTEGEIAGYAAAGRIDRAHPLFSKRASAQRFASAMSEAFALRPELRQLAERDTIVCRCEDVPLGRLEIARSARAAKLQTRFGMGPCQGRVCGPAAQFLFGWQPDTVRPPFYPARIGSLAKENDGSAEAKIKL